MNFFPYETKFIFIPLWWVNPGYLDWAGSYKPGSNYKITNVCVPMVFHQVDTMCKWAVATPLCWDLLFMFHSINFNKGCSMTRLSRQQLNKAVTAVGTTGSPTLTPVMVFSMFSYAALFKLAMRSNSAWMRVTLTEAETVCCVTSQHVLSSQLSVSVTRIGTIWHRKPQVFQASGLRPKCVSTWNPKQLTRSHEDVYTTKHFPTIKILPK